MGRKKPERRDRIKLSDRLLMSASRVTPGNVVADVGCDHAHTAIWLVKQGIAPRAIAMDVGKGPLERAAANIRLFKCEEYIETRLSDGLEKLEPGEADTVIIAGMGGLLTTQILTRGLRQMRAARELVLQPQSDIDAVRELLYNNGFDIVEEDMCFEDGKFYTAIKAENRCCGSEDMQGTDVRKENDDDEGLLQVYFKYGKQLLEQKHPVLKEQLENRYTFVKGLIGNLAGSETESARARLSDFEAEKKLLEKALEFFRDID